MSKIEKVLLSGKTRTMIHGGAGRSREGNVDIRLSTPGSESTPAHVFENIVAHPTAEQLFAGAWSACYISAIALVAQEKKVQLPPDLAVEIEVDLGQTGKAYFIQARFDVQMPGLAHDLATAIAHAAHEICPYSKATHGNIDVAMVVRV